MNDETVEHPLTDSRILRILEIEPELRRRARKDAGKFLKVPRRPRTGDGETLHDVIAPQMAGYFRDGNEDPARFLKDRERLLMVYSAIKAGGVQTVLERYRRLTADDSLAAGIEDMKTKGLGHPAALSALLPQMKKNAEAALAKLKSVSPAEERAVESRLPEIESVLIFRGKDIEVRKPRKA